MTKKLTGREALAMSEVKDREFSNKRVSRVFMEISPDIRRSLMQNNGHMDHFFARQMEQLADDCVAYGRANPLPQPDSKDIKKMLLRFTEALRCPWSDKTVHETIDKFLEQEQK